MDTKNVTSMCLFPYYSLTCCDSNGVVINTVHVITILLLQFIPPLSSIIYIKSFLLQYEWCYFEGRNEATRRAFLDANLDVLFVDFNPATTKRFILKYFETIVYV